MGRFGLGGYVESFGAVAFAYYRNRIPRVFLEKNSISTETTDERALREKAGNSSICRASHKTRCGVRAKK